MRKYNEGLHHHRGKLALLVLIFMVAAGVLYLFGLDRYGLFDVDEAIFAQTSVEMLTSGDYVTPTYNGEPRYHKPPLIYWLQSFSMEKLGVGPLGARLPSALLALLTVLMFYVTLEGITKNGRFALSAAAILGVNLSFLLLARAAVADMALNFLALSATMVLLGNILGPVRRTMPSVIAGFLLSGALLAKGPVALLMPAVAVGTVTLVYGDFHHNLKRLRPVLILLAMAFGLIPWMVMITKAHGWEFFQEFIMVHNVQRYFDGLDNSHSSSPFYYLIVLLFGFFPWVLFLPSAMGWLGKNFKHFYRHQKLEHILAMAGLAWLVTVVLVFSFSATRLPHYIVPALPGAALLLAARFEGLGEKTLHKISWLWVLPLTALVALPFLVLQWVPRALVGEGPLAPAIAHLQHKFEFEWPLTDPLLLDILALGHPFGIGPVAIGGLFLVGVLAATSLMTTGHRQGVALLVITTWMALAIMVVNIAPTVYAYQQQPLADIAQQIKERAGEQTRVYMVGLHQPSVRFLSGRPFTPINSPGELLNLRPFPVHGLFVMDVTHKDTALEYLPMGAKAECNGGYCLVDIRQTRSRRLPGSEGLPY